MLRLIDAAKARALAAVNTALIDLHWALGEYISRRVADNGWGQGTVKTLAEHIAKRRPNPIGFSARNLWRMMQFYETYRDRPKLGSPALLMIRSRPPVQRSPFSGEISIIPDQGRGVFVKSAGEPKNVTTGDRIVVDPQPHSSWATNGDVA